MKPTGPLPPYFTASSAGELIIGGSPVSELIAEATLAMRLEATAEDLVATIHAHPTLAETLREVALVAVGTAIHTAGR